LNFVPYRIDLTPFAGVLSNGQPHTIALSVYNADSYFSATGTLLVYLDHGAQQVTEQVTENTIGSGPNPTINENVRTDSSGNITAAVTTTSSRKFKLAGFVNTSHGRVDAQVKQMVNFKNDQSFEITASTYSQDFSEEAEMKSTTDTRQGEMLFETKETLSYPLTVDYTLTFAATGP